MSPQVTDARRAATAAPQPAADTICHRPGAGRPRAKAWRTRCLRAAAQHHGAFSLRPHVAQGQEPSGASDVGPCPS